MAFQNNLKQIQNNLTIKSFKIIFLLFFLIGCKAIKTANKSQNQHSYSISATEIVKILSSDTLEGRAIGTEEYDKAAEFITLQLEKLKIPPYFKSGYLDTFKVYQKSTYNIVALIEAKIPTKECILIGAHLDHIGKTHSSDDTVYNGANDNATGVAATLKIAEHLSKKTLTKNVIIALFSAEENGLLGSKHLAKVLLKDSIDIRYMINFEMLGVSLENTPGKVYISGYDKSNFAEIANSLLEEKFILYNDIEKRMAVFRMSDNYPFYKNLNIPAHTISTFEFDNYKYLHDVRDDFSRIDTNHLTTIIQKSTILVERLIFSDAEIILNNN